MTDQALAVIDNIPAIAPRDVKSLYVAIHRLKDEIFTKDVDYGRIPGTTKDVLYLPGMEKIMRFMRLRPEYTILETSIVDFRTPLFSYEIECRLIEVETGLIVYTAIGSCNSRETKFRYRVAARKCPNCGAEAIIKGKQEYGGGWICFDKKGGCKAKFQDNDPRIVDQPTGMVENENIADLANTLIKMAQKRALGSASKGVANVSDLFTVDLEDFANEDTARGNTAEGSPTKNIPPDDTPSGKVDKSVKLSNAKAVNAFYKEVKARGKKPADAAAALMKAGVELKNITHGEAITLLFGEDQPESDPPVPPSDMQQGQYSDEMPD